MKPPRMTECEGKHTHCPLGRARALYKLFLLYVRLMCFYALTM